MPGSAPEQSPVQERPTAPIRTETFRSARPDIVGPDVPEPPFPITLSGPVQRGFGRGGKDLGCPTGTPALMSHAYRLLIMGCIAANLPDESLPQINSVETGVYYGYAQVYPSKDGNSTLFDEDVKVLPMVMSLGWNPFYKNERMTAVRFLLILSPFSYRSPLYFLLYDCRKFMLCMNSSRTFTGMN